MDKGTVVRTVLLVIALVNQVFGAGTLVVAEGDVSTTVDVIYLVGSTLFTAVMSLVTWFKNNYITKKGKEQKRVLEQHNLK